MENVNQIKLVITKFNDKKIIISVYSKQNDRYITRSGKLFDLLDMNLFYPLNRNKNKVYRLVNNIIENNNEIVFNGKRILDVSNVYYDKSLINKDIKLSGDIFKIKEKHVLVTHISTDWEVMDKLTDEVVWSSINNTENLLSTNIEIGALSTNTDYFIKARFNGSKDIVSNTASLLIKTKESKPNSNNLLTSEELDTIFKQLKPIGISELLNEYKKITSEAIKTRTRKNVPPYGTTKTEDLAEWVNKMGFNFKYEDPNIPEPLKTSEKISSTEDGKFVIVLNEDYDMKFFNTYEDLLEFVKYTGIDLFKIGSKLNYEVKGLLSESYKMLLINHNRPEKVKFYYAGNFVRNNKRKVVYKKLS